jgi:hypothetical protein
LKYTRRDKTSGYAGYEYDPGSGTRGSYWVDDSTVDQVAKEGGTLRDFEKHEKKKK